jgi:hypothetical protein
MPNLKAIEKLIRRQIPVKKVKTVAQSAKPQVQQPIQAERPKVQHQPQQPRYLRAPHPVAVSSRHPGQSRGGHSRPDNSRGRHPHRRRLIAAY